MKPYTLPYHLFSYGGENKLQFLNGQDKQYSKATFFDDKVLVMEKYFVGLYEKEFEPQTGITRHINYITAGDGMTAIVLQEEESGDVLPDETYFTYKDHLGSIVALTDDNGDVVLEQSFDAWGRYRNPDDWSYNILNPSPTWLRGYTGHEHLPHFDLINMNGRVYDPILGRMLSPDRFVQDPLFSQSYNRYSYCWNNPLRYTDPSGDFVVTTSIIIGAVAGAYIGGSIANNTFSISQWAWTGEDAWKTYTGIGLGAVAGAFGGWAVGTQIQAGTMSAQAIASKTFAGTMNAAYNYESGQSAWATLGYFGAGFGGAHMGGVMNSAFAAMAAGGYGNVGVYFTEQVITMVITDGEEGSLSGYEMAQKFVSGALNAYAGYTMLNPSAGYIKGFKNKYLFNNKMLSKGASYTLQNHAATFAYTDKEKYLSMSGRQFLGITGTGFLAGIANYGIGQEISTTNPSWGPVLDRTHKFLGGIGVSYLDYIANHQIIYGNYYGGPTEYYGYGNKIGIGSVKNTFIHLLIAP